MSVAAPLLDPRAANTHRLRNLLHSVLLVTGIGGIAAFGAWLLWGEAGAIGALVAMLALLLFGPRVSPELVMRLFHAEALDRDEAPKLYRVTDELARRAGLDNPPKLYLVPSDILNAFAVGTPDKSSIAVTSGLLQTLRDRELVGVLAHELSHVRNNDLWIMGLADMMSRFTQMMSTMGLIFMIANGVLLLFGSQPVLPWSVALLLYAMPLASSLLQLALSRAREYDADLEAAQLTGDPDGLASALARLERHQGRLWEDMLPSGRRIAIPSVLRSHPASEERIRRLSELKAQPATPPLYPAEPEARTITLVVRQPAVRRRMTLPGIRI
jgi:heat shock protein HtpX